ncbi:fungal-specific transcription factor domain-containing protein [Aspergillus recurvatus]
MREACWTCRIRTVQCDQSRFPCLKCEKAGLECRDKKPLRWVKGVAIRGRMRGYEYKATPINRATVVSVHAKPKQVKRRDLQLQFALQDPHVQNLDQSSRYYIDYYCKRICKLYILHDSDSNPFRGLLAYALEDVPLRKSITALAARHLANTGYSFGLSEADVAIFTSPQSMDTALDALCFKTEAITALRERLANPHPEPSKTDMGMATILLLIFLELLESGLDGWDVHLKGARALVGLYKSLGGYTNNSGSGEMEQEIRTFIARQLSLIGTLGAALSHSNSPFEDSGSANYALSKGQESIVRSFLGCPEFILRSIQFFSTQRHLAAEATPHDGAHDQNTLAMLEISRNFNSLEWATGFQLQQSSASAPFVAEVKNLYMLGEAYKTAALLYGRRVLGPETASATTTGNKDVVLQLLGLIEALKDQDTLFKCLLWPTFIAGLHCLERDQQGLIHDSLRRIWNLTNCLNVVSASNILKDYWERAGTSESQLQPRVELDHRWLLI